LQKRSKFSKSRPYSLNIRHRTGKEVLGRTCLSFHFSVNITFAGSIRECFRSSWSGTGMIRTFIQGWKALPVRWRARLIAEEEARSDALFGSKIT
jgi:hypothetical protein